jgi:hypothetical protein
MKEIVGADAIIMKGSNLGSISSEKQMTSGKTASIEYGSVGYLIIKPNTETPYASFTISVEPVVASTFFFIIIAYSIFGIILIFGLCMICFVRSIILGKLDPVNDKLD